jgi:hypothetical protein
MATAPLWPLAPGRSASYTLIGRTERQTTSRYTETWRVLRTETLEIGGSPRNTVVLQRRQKGMPGSNVLGTDTVWFDIEAGVFVKRNVGVTRDRSGGRPFEALSIVLPAGR